MWKEKLIESTPPFFDLELGADVTDLDNSTYFNTLEALKTPLTPDNW